MCRRQPLGHAPWLTDYRDQCFIESENSILLKSTSPLDHKYKLQDHAEQLMERNRNTHVYNDQFCTQCKLGPFNKTLKQTTFK